jgi:DNA polymerase V
MKNMNKPTGFSSPAEDYLQPNLDLNSFLINRPAATFFMQVQSDRSFNHGICRGDILIVDKAEPMRKNSIVIAVVDGEMQIVPVHQLQKREAQIWGIATALIHKF